MPGEGGAKKNQGGRNPYSIVREGDGVKKADRFDRHRRGGVCTEARCRRGPQKHHFFVRPEKSHRISVCSGGKNFLRIASFGGDKKRLGWFSTPSREGGKGEKARSFGRKKRRRPRKPATERNGSSVELMTLKGRGGRKVCRARGMALDEKLQNRGGETKAIPSERGVIFTASEARHCRDLLQGT